MHLFTSVASHFFLSSLNFPLSLFKIFKSSLFLFFIDFLFSKIFRFLVLNCLNQDFLIFEPITLGKHVKSVIQMFVDFSLFSVFSQKSSKNSLSSHPKNFFRHSSILSTSSFTYSHVSSFSFFFMPFKGSES